MAEKNKIPSTAYKSLNQNFRELFGKFDENTGGGEPMGMPNAKKWEKGGRGVWSKTYKREPKRDSGQPKTDDGKFTYNSVNGKPLKESSKVHGKSRGTTVNPILTGGENGVRVDKYGQTWKTRNFSEEVEYWGIWKEKWVSDHKDMESLFDDVEQFTEFVGTGSKGQNVIKYVTKGYHFDLEKFLDVFKEFANEEQKKRGLTFIGIKSRERTMSGEWIVEGGAAYFESLKIKFDGSLSLEAESKRGRRTITEKDAIAKELGSFVFANAKELADEKGRKIYSGGANKQTKEDVELLPEDTSPEVKEVFNNFEKIADSWLESDVDEYVDKLEDEIIRIIRDNRLDSSYQEIEDNIMIDLLDMLNIDPDDPEAEENTAVFFINHAKELRDYLRNPKNIEKILNDSF